MPVIRHLPRVRDLRYKADIGVVDTVRQWSAGKEVLYLGDNVGTNPIPVCMKEAGREPIRPWSFVGMDGEGRFLNLLR